MVVCVCVHTLWDVLWQCIAAVHPRDYAHSLSSLRWRHNELDGVSDHQPHDCLLNRLFGRRSKKNSTLRVTGLCAGYSPGTGEFPAQKASNAENVSIWWRHYVLLRLIFGTWQYHPNQGYFTGTWAMPLNTVGEYGKTHHTNQLEIVDIR